MSEKLGGQIDTKQTEIESLKGPAAAKTEIARYRSTYINAVDAGQRSMKTAAGKLKSPEAKSYLKKASGEIAGQLGSMADRGREIIKAHEDEKDGKSEKVPSMAKLSGDLSKKLGQLKKSIDSFKILEEIENDDLPKIEKENDTLNSSEGSKDPLDVFSAKEKLIGKLNRLGPKFTSTAGSREYSKKVVKKYQDLTKKIGEEKDELAFGPTARHIIAHDFFKEVSTYENLVKKVESDPSMDTLRAAEAQAEKIDPATAYSEIFDDRDKGSYAYIENMYKHLEAEFNKSKSSYESLKEGFDEAEKEALTQAAKKMIADIEAAEKETVGPLWAKYEPLSHRTDLSGKELEDYEKSEEALMAAYLTLKMTVSPFAHQETQFKLADDIYKQVQAKVKEVNDRIRQIEVNRQTRKSMTSLGEVGPNVYSYVTFLGEEKDGKIYTFNAAYDALSEEKKQEVRMAVESIIARDEKAVKAETQKAMVELSKSSGDFDQISEVLGEKSKKYAEGLKLLASGKHNEALKAFESYVAQTFSPEEKEINSAALADAKEKILLVKYSGEFYEGLQQYGAGDINGAAKNLTAYVEWAEGSGNKELHKEQISQARDMLHLIGLSKVKQLDDLLEDVKYWKKKDLQDQYGSGGQKIDFKISGPEVDIIVNGINDLKKKVENGDLIDYDEEFSKMKSRVHLYLQENAIDPENNVINKYSELYEGMNSTDPKVRKETCIKFAKELRDLRGYDKAREYLDKALADEYREAAKEVSQEKIMKEMLGDKMIMDNVRKAASAYLSQFKKDNPGIPEDQLKRQAEQIVFNMWLQKRYSRELRHHMTGQGLADSSEALSLYNNWSPYEEDVDTSWYKPWNYSYMNAEEYDQFKDAAKENLALTIATLPIGFGAGAAGAQIGKVAFRALATRLLVRTGAVGAETAILAIEQGGVQAIKFGSQAWKALTPQMQRAVILSRVGAGALSVTVEGTLLLGGSTAAEGIITGESTPITSANLVESIFKALAFRGIGMGGNKLFGKAIEAGGKRGMKALVAMESMSGIAGTGIEAASLYAKGHGDYVDTGFMLRSLLENAITSTGMHWAHRKFEGGASKTRNKVEEAYNKKVVSDAESELGITFNDPESIRTARITPEGHVEINGKVVQHFTADVLGALPQKARKKIELLTGKKSPSHIPQGSKPSADIEGFKKQLEDMDLPESQRKQIEATIERYERAELNGKELDAAVHASFNESRKILIPDPDHPGQMKEVDLHSDYRTKNFAYSPEMTTYLNDHAKLQTDGPVIVKHGGDEIVILHAGPDGKTEMYFGDVGNMGPSNEFSLRVKGGDANLVDLYLRDLAAVIKSEFVPGKEVNGPQVLDRIKNRLAKKYFGVETEAAFNALKKEYDLEGTWQDYQRNMNNANILAGFRSDARGLQAEFLKEYPEADSAADAVRDNKDFAAFVGKKIDALDGGSPPLTDVLRDNLDTLAESGALKDLLPEGLSGTNSDVLTKDGLAKILKKKDRTAEEQLIVYFALRRVNAHDIPPISGVDTSHVGERFAAIRQNPDDVTLMDFQMAGVEVPSFEGRSFDHTDMKFFLDKVLEDALHKAKENKGVPDIERVKSPFDESGNLPDSEYAAEHAKAAQDDKPAQVNEFLQLKEAAAAKLDQIKAQVDKMSSQEKPSRADVDELLRLKGEYDKLVAGMNQRKFSDPETGVDRPAKFAEDADFWLRNQRGERIPPERQMMREFVFDLHNTGAINAQRGYAVTDAAMSALALQLKQKFPGASAVVRSGGGQLRVYYFDSASLPTIGGQPMSFAQHQAHMEGQLGSLSTTVHDTISPNGKTSVDGIVRDATSKMRSKPSEGAAPVGEVKLTGQAEVNHQEFREGLKASEPPASLFKIREYRGQEQNGKPAEGNAKPEEKEAA